MGISWWQFISIDQQVAGVARERMNAGNTNGNEQKAPSTHEQGVVDIPNSSRTIRKTHTNDTGESLRLDRIALSISVSRTIQIASHSGTPRNVAVSFPFHSFTTSYLNGFRTYVSHNPALRDSRGRRLHAS